MIFKHVWTIFRSHRLQRKRIFNIFRGCFYLDFFSLEISEGKNKHESFMYIDKSYLNANFPWHDLFLSLCFPHFTFFLLLWKWEAGKLLSKYVVIKTNSQSISDDVFHNNKMYVRMGKLITNPHTQYILAWAWKVLWLSSNWIICS